MQEGIIKDSKVYLIVVVLYRCSIKESSTIQSLLAISERFRMKFHLAIWDNSEERQDQTELNEISKSFLNFTYGSTGENLPLSLVYNQAIREYGSNCDYVNIWDQDSEFDDYYYIMIDEALSKADVRLFVPQVYTGTKLVSPGAFEWFKGKYLTSVDFGVINSKNIIGIMSGIFVNSSVFKFVEFDERLRFYGIDTKFFIDYSKHWSYLYVLDYRLTHSLSLYNKDELICIKIFRFEEFCRSSVVINSEIGIIGVFFMKIHLIFTAIRNVIEYKDFGFMSSLVRALFPMS